MQFVGEFYGLDSWERREGNWPKGSMRTLPTLTSINPLPKVHKVYFHCPHLVVLYCSMGQVKSHRTALGVLWLESGRIIPLMHAWPGTLVVFPCLNISSFSKAPEQLHPELWALDGELLLCYTKQSFFLRAGWWALLGCSRACRSFDVKLKRNFLRASVEFFPYLPCTVHSLPARIMWTYFN